MHAGDVLVQQAGIQQLADQKAQPAGCLELIHVGFAIGVDACQQWGGARQGIEIVPVDQDAGGACDRHQVQRVIGGAAGGGQADHGIDDGFFVEGVCQRSVVWAERRDPQGLFGCRDGEGVT